MAVELYMYGVWCVQSVNIVQCYWVSYVLLLLGLTVFCGPWNFEPSCGICPFAPNFDIAA